MREPQFLGFRICKGSGFTICRSWAFRCQRSFFFNFEPLFQVWLLFWVPHPIIWQKYLSFSNAEFNSASTDTSLNIIGGTTKKLEYPFLFAPSRFLAKLIRFTFLIFPDPSGRVGHFFPDPGDGEKLARTFKRKSLWHLFLYSWAFAVNSSL